VLVALKVPVSGETELLLPQRTMVELDH